MMIDNVIHPSSANGITQAKRLPPVSVSAARVERKNADDSPM